MYKSICYVKTSVFKLKDEMCKKAANINQQNNHFVFHILRF